MVGRYKQKIKRIRELHAIWSPVPPALLLLVCSLVFAGLAFLLIMCEVEKRKSQGKTFTDMAGHYPRVCVCVIVIKRIPGSNLAGGTVCLALDRQPCAAGIL